jgi:hypothetical protein
MFFSKSLANHSAHCVLSRKLQQAQSKPGKQSPVEEDLKPGFVGPGRWTNNY